MTPLVRRFPGYRRHMIWFGWPISLSGLVAASFVDSIPALIMTQGIIYGVGFVMIYYPIISFLNEWWIRHRGMAFGTITCSSGASGLIMPFVIEALLNKYGRRTTLRALVVSIAILTGPLLPLLRPRLPSTAQAVTAPTNWAFLKHLLFWLYFASNVAQGFAFFFPALFLPTYAASIGLGATSGALLLSLMSVAQVLGQFTFGFLSDEGRLPLNLLAIAATTVAAVATLTLWGLAQGLVPLVLFALLYGFFGYGFSVIGMRMGTVVSRVDQSAALATFGIFTFGQGIGNVLAGPISAGLLSRVTSPGSYAAGKYKGVVAFTGGCMLLSALSVGSWYLKPRRSRSVGVNSS